MILYRFVSERWVGTDGYSFSKPKDIIMEAKDIEWFIARYPYVTFQVTTLMDEESHRTNALDRFILQELKRPLAGPRD
jgi:hypothetical protein